MSVSPIQLAANIANAQLATGPCTQEGKQHSSQNAVTHGLFAKTIPACHREAYRRILEQLREDLDPTGAVEEQFVETIANAQWRLARCRELQEALLFADTETPGQHLDALNKYSLYEQRLARMIQSYMKQLLEIRYSNRVYAEERFRDAAKIAEHLATQQIDFDPRQDGFVFSAEDLADWMRRRDRLENARLSQNHRRINGQSVRPACW